MHFYWRIIEELKYLNENWVMKDPSLLRAYERWVRKNAHTISLSLKDCKEFKRSSFHYRGIPCSLS